jgi:hypothetical protein
VLFRRRACASARRHRSLQSDLVRFAPFGESIRPDRRRTLAGVRLWCVEYCRPSPPDATGWRMLRVDVREEDDEPILAVYSRTARSGSSA